MRRAKVSGEKPRSRARGFIAEKRVGTLLGTGSNPRRGRGLFSLFFFCGARSDSSGLSLSLLFRFALLSSLPLFLLARRSRLLHVLLCLISTVMHFPAALFTCFRPSTSVLESPREHSPVHLSSSRLVKEASVKNHCAPRRVDPMACVRRNVENNGITPDFSFSVADKRNGADASLWRCSYGTFTRNSESLVLETNR